MNEPTEGVSRYAIDNNLPLPTEDLELIERVHNEKMSLGCSVPDKETLRRETLEHLELFKDAVELFYSGQGKSLDLNVFKRVIADEIVALVYPESEKQ